MENELASLTAHHASEQDDMSNELNEKMAVILEELKKKAKISYQHELDSMNTRFNEDCEAAKSMMGSLFGNILPITNKDSASSPTSSSSSSNNVSYIVRIQQEYAEMHTQQMKTATMLADIARQASRLRRDLRESKRAQLLAARARAEIPLLVRENLASHSSLNEHGNVTERMLIETNRRLVNKLQRMSTRYSNLEDELSTTMRLESNAKFDQVARRSTNSTRSISRVSRQQASPVFRTQDEDEEDEEDEKVYQRMRESKGVRSSLSPSPLLSSVALELSSDSDE